MVENFGLKEIAIIGLSAVIAYMLLGNVGLAITALVGPAETGEERKSLGAQSWAPSFFLYKFLFREA